MVIVEPKELFDFFSTVAHGLFSYEAEESLSLPRNSLRRHLAKPGFRQLPDKRYCLNTDSFEQFCVLQGYAVVKRVRSADYPFEIEEWKKELAGFSLGDLVAGLQTVQLKDFNDWLEPAGLAKLYRLSEMLQYYVDTVTSDPRFPDEEAKQYILKVRLL